MNEEIPFLSGQVSENQSAAEQCYWTGESVTIFLILNAVTALQPFFTFYSHRTSQAKPWLDYSALITKCTQTKGAIVPGTYVHVSFHFNTKDQNAVWSCCKSAIFFWQDLCGIWTDITVTLELPLVCRTPDSVFRRVLWDPLGWTIQEKRKRREAKLEPRGKWSPYPTTHQKRKAAMGHSLLAAVRTR